MIRQIKKSRLVSLFESELISSNADIQQMHEYTHSFFCNNISFARYDVIMLEFTIFTDDLEKIGKGLTFEEKIECFNRIINKKNYEIYFRKHTWSE